ncbi:hypothetical protein NDU88_007229 [Pleurodeles waltl]|uniref:Uncharacterized protein n=1 Tax=Pleurodeles waltl TaxID=8319 RepID=A0AAV7QK20_PLEWA|nr:hypothetical protein NDU88_007229 [Pleurodeles waltl]
MSPRAHLSVPPIMDVSLHILREGGRPGHEPPPIFNAGQMRRGLTLEGGREPGDTRGGDEEGWPSALPHIHLVLREAESSQAGHRQEPLQQRRSDHQPESLLRRS